MMSNGSGSDLPSVSVVMPVRNERSSIAGTLDSILANDYPPELLEILVVDGMSTDGTRDIVAEYSARFPFIRLLDNPRKIRVTGNNVGIRAAVGEIVVSMDAHVRYASDYISECVRLLRTTGAANVGGLQRAVGHNYVTRAIALAMSSPFGVGNAEFRYREKQMWVEAAYLGAWYRKTLMDVGLFNEEWLRNGDYELNYRIRKAGGRVLMSPTIRCEYSVRGSLLKLARQYYLYGLWRLRTVRQHPESVRWRHMLPPGLVLLVLLGLCLMVPGVPFWWLPPSLYALYTVVGAMGICLRKGLHYFPALVASLWVMHLCWGAGFLMGMIRFGVPRIRLRKVISDLRGASAP